MKSLTLLEVGNLGGLIAMIIIVFILAALFISFIITMIVKVYYEWKGDKKFSRKQFIQTMLISLLLCGLVSGAICGGGL
ncbi:MULTISPECIES: hypothetical protein [Chryseobacterium]|jgi:ABC-type Fe3+ transport system permease subunit|uniref:ABC-type Fe3+ transport system permease subunit n=1 Tax=Chryseobacterium geocarposphaerae TaxID=1416776 RepID=A0ABU1LEN7_9FLAO|nr:MULTISPECIES: hypothetical protein [Chryseobacterium]MDR6405015.1 ABC-type Fe3+ transport system permease subunit [Chryseobacterium geocarposphaerae]MDR6697798.1 ABC-type Fe3+ transport system permease subunit [Chryseobacterium ginsenosidimutans]